MRRSHRSRSFGLALLALAVLASGGCLGRSPAPRLYALRAVSGPTVDTARELALAVGPVGLPHYLTRPQLVTRQGRNEIVVDEFHRWAGGLEANVLRVLAEDLGQRLQTRRVVAAPAAAPFPIDYQVVVDFDELVGNAGGEFALAARWVIRSGAGETLHVEVSSATETVAGSGIPDVIGAYEQALGGLADAIAGRIAELSRRATAGEAGD